MTKHFPQSLEIGRKAVEVDPENYHAWVNYGISLSHDSKYDDAIDCFKKALELNPHYLPIYLELGTTKMYMANYAEAEKDFLLALKEESSPNYFHIQKALISLSECYHRWGLSFYARGDYEGQIEKLKLAEKRIQEAMSQPSQSKRAWKQYFKINKEFGIALGRINISEGIQYLEKCLKTVNIGNRVYPPTDEIVSEACFFIASLLLNSNDKNYIQIMGYVEQGFSNTSMDSKYYSKFQSLKKQVEDEFPNKSEAIPPTTPTKTNTFERKYGYISWVDSFDKYGIIDSGERKVFFVISDMKDRILKKDIETMIGKKVSFILQKNPRKENQLVAKAIEIEP